MQCVVLIGCALESTDDIGLIFEKTEDSYRVIDYKGSATSIEILAEYKGLPVTSIEYSAFYYCSSLTSITFQGTVAEWNAITKGSDWNKSIPATSVVCSDGSVFLN